MALPRRGVEEPQPRQQPQPDQDGAVVGEPGGRKGVGRVQDEERSGEPGGAGAPAAAPQQPIKKYNGETEKGQMNDVEGQRVQAEYVELGGPQRHGKRAIIGPSGFPPGPPDVGEPSGPVEPIAVREVAEAVLAAELQVVVVVEPEAERQAVAVKAPRTQDQRDRRQEVRAPAAGGNGARGGRGNSGRPKRCEKAEKHGRPGETRRSKGVLNKKYRDFRRGT